MCRWRLPYRVHRRRVTDYVMLAYAVFVVNGERKKTLLQVCLSLVVRFAEPVLVSLLFLEHVIPYVLDQVAQPPHSMINVGIVRLSRYTLMAFLHDDGLWQLAQNELEVRTVGAPIVPSVVTICRDVSVQVPVCGVLLHVVVEPCDDGVVKALLLTAVLGVVRCGEDFLDLKNFAYMLEEL